MILIYHTHTHTPNPSLTQFYFEVGLTLGAGVFEVPTHPTVSVSKKVLQPPTQGVEQIYVSVVVGFFFGQQTPGHPTVEVATMTQAGRKQPGSVTPVGQGVIMVDVMVGQSGPAKVVITDTVVVVITFLVRIGQVCFAVGVKVGMGSERVRVLEKSG